MNESINLLLSWSGRGCPQYPGEKLVSKMHGKGEKKKKKVNISQKDKL